MNVEQILGRLAGGFRPFVIRTSDGREYPVPHPEFIAVASTCLRRDGRGRQVNR